MTKIDRYMRHPVVTIKSGDTIAHARELLERNRINQLPVVSDGRLVGIVTDRDLRDAFPSVFAQGGATDDPVLTVKVQDVATANVLTLSPDATVTDAARLMRRERIGALPITTDGRLVGIVTRSDVLKAYLDATDTSSRAAT